MSKIQSIASKTEIAKIHIAFICPTCNRDDKVVIFSPKFCTDTFPISIKDKIEHLLERVCRACYSEMYIKHIQCDL